MRPPAWSEGIDTGVSHLDAEHQLQASLLDALDEALRADRDRAAVERTFGQLVDFTAVHFGSEELLMRLHGYPRLEEHATAHAKLLEQVRSIRRRHAEAGAAAARDVVAELRGWLVSHIRGLDGPFAAWLEENGIRPP
jgi:hemerythrin